MMKLVRTLAKVLLTLTCNTVTAAAHTENDTLLIDDRTEKRDTVPDSLALAAKPRANIYDMPYSTRTSCPDWGRMWLHTGVLYAAGIATLGVLELLPDNATKETTADSFQCYTLGFGVEADPEEYNGYFSTSTGAGSWKGTPKYSLTPRTRAWAMSSARVRLPQPGSPCSTMAWGNRPAEKALQSASLTWRFPKKRERSIRLFRTGPR